MGQGKGCPLLPSRKQVLLQAAAAHARLPPRRGAWEPHECRNARHACLLQRTAPQVEVETLRYTLTDLQETCAQAETSSSGRPAATIELPTIQPPGASAALYATHTMLGRNSKRPRSSRAPASVAEQMLVNCAACAPPFPCIALLNAQVPAAVANSSATPAASQPAAAVYRGCRPVHPSGTASWCSPGAAAVAAAAARQPTASAAAHGRQRSTGSRRWGMWVGMTRRGGEMGMSVMRL